MTQYEKSDEVNLLHSGWLPYPPRQMKELMADASPEMRECLNTMVERIQKLSEISISLSAERDLPALLERIVDEARTVTHADGGTLYLVSNDGKFLNFEIAHTRSLDIFMGGSSGDAITWSPVPLYAADGTPNEMNVSAYVALTGEMISIPDVYNIEGFDFTGTREFDASTGYRSKSMLVLPLRNHEDNIIGVLQLLNKIDPETGDVIAFSKESEDLVAGLASQAAVAITNTQLIHDLENLFESFIQVIAAAIDEKSPYTGNHISRVANLTVDIAKAVNKVQEGELAEVHFDEDEMQELRIAAWMHDIGKITTPEYVVDKATKLQTIYDKINAVELRYEILKRDIEIARLKNQLNEQETPSATHSGQLTENPEELKRQLEDELAWIKQANFGGEFISEERKQKIDRIAGRTYHLNGEEKRLLEPQEVVNLKIARGTLNDEERQIIQNHAAVSKRMLEQLPYPKKLQNIPYYAGAHHEKLDGSGYPDALEEKEIPMQARIMALADVFEALTAEDRPYKPGKTLSEAMKILSFMVRDNHIDGRLFRLFIKSGLIETYAHEHIKPEQIDYVEFDLQGQPKQEKTTDRE